MRLHVADHPLVSHKLTVLRDVATPSPTFRQLVDELVVLLAYEATRDVAVVPVEVVTPVAPTTGVKIAGRPLVVPVLRAGLGMLAGMVRLLPRRGWLPGDAARRDDPGGGDVRRPAAEDLAGRQCFLLDPMLATGGTLAAAVDDLLTRGARDVTALCLVAAPEGLATLERSVGTRTDVTVVVAAVDEGLDDQAYIVPGLGDAGDRLYGVV